MRRLIVLAFAMFIIPGTSAAAASCGPWIPQTNGTAWRICVDDQGRQFCQVQRNGGIKQIRCP